MTRRIVELEDQHRNLAEGVLGRIAKLEERLESLTRAHKVTWATMDPGAPSSHEARLAKLESQVIAHEKHFSKLLDRLEALEEDLEAFQDFNKLMVDGLASRVVFLETPKAMKMCQEVLDRMGGGKPTEAVMTPDDVARRLSEVRKQADAGDDEAAHGREDALLWAFVEAVAEGTCESPQECAKAILTSNQIDFGRWCA